jgi:TRAP-type mannitol/chloroaromatic compound transport system substrate-binding protein
VLGFYKVANHYYFPGWHQPGSVSFLMVNQRKWDSLSERSRAVLEVTCRATVAWEVARGIGQQAEAMAYFSEQGVQFHTWSDEMMEAFRKATTEVMEEQSATDEDFRRLYENQQAFLAGVRDWSLLSDIPPHQR